MFLFFMEANHLLDITHAFESYESYPHNWKNFLYQNLVQITSFNLWRDDLIHII